MSRGTSSLRRTERRWGLALACAGALAFAAPAYPAALPTPDDPPSGPRSEASPLIREAPTGAESTQTSSRSLVPAPDAPVTSAPTRSSPSPTPPRETTDAPSTTIAVAPSHPTPATAAPAPRATGDSHRNAAPPRATRPAKTKPKPKPRSTPQHHTDPAPALARLPHDSTRLGLPVGTLTLVADAGGDTARGALLAAAALLLGAAGAGGFVVGIATRRFARIA